MTMSRVNRIHFCGTVSSRDQARPLMAATGDAVLIERGVPRALILRCPCGCGDDLILNLDRRAGPAWRMYRRREKLTVYPSYWRETACGSHFIISSDRILWCHSRDDDGDSELEDIALQSAVLAALTDHAFQGYEEVAERLDEIPWEVLWTCRQLVKKGKIVEGSWKQRGMFKKVAPSSGELDRKC